MAADYNARLIAELYNSSNVEKATEISEEMADIGDPIFPLQIYEAYKKFQGTSRQHYFVSDLSSFQSPEADEILKIIVSESDRQSDINMLLDRMVSIAYFPPVLTNKVKKYAINDLLKNELDEYDVTKYSEYLRLAGHINEFENLYKENFESQTTSASVKSSLLNELLKIDKVKYLTYYLENYESIKGSRTEVVFVKEISTWKGAIIEKLKSKILEEGSETAKQIIIKSQKEKAELEEKKEKTDQEQVLVRFNNASIIESISRLRIDINIVANNHPEFMHKFFKSSELLNLQSKSAQSKADIVSSIVDLRNIIRDFDDSIINLKYSQVEVQEFIPDIKEHTGSINQFYTYLKKKGIDVDNNFYGLRSLNTILSKFAHPGQEEELILFLSKENLNPLFIDGNWQKLHFSILKLYDDFLTRLLASLKKSF